MDFKLTALNHTEFEHLFKLSDGELENKGMKRMIVDEYPGYPCRVSLEDAEIGEEVILLPYEFHKTNSPYRASGPIFVRKGIKTKHLVKNEIPLMMNHRFLSFRAYDLQGFMLDARTEKGINSNTLIQEIFENPEIEYIHIHNANPGCFNCEVRKIG